MNTTPQIWFAYGPAGATALRCAACGTAIDLQFPADHHLCVCPACGVECAFLNWKDRLVQIVIDRAPRPLGEGLRWAQRHLDELEYVELLYGLEEIADALNEGSVTPPNAAVQLTRPA